MYRPLKSLSRLLSGSLITASLACLTQADNRLAYGPDAPDWLRAVGALQVPGIRLKDGRRRSHREDCSATLVTASSGRPADTIVTAWHCLEFYRDLSRPVTFTLFKGSAEALVMEARRLDDGGGMHADWAILRLQTPVPPDRVAAVNLHPGRADPGRRITMAGYSKDSGLGQLGEQLTYDPECSIIRQEDQLSHSDCIAYMGASGGAVVQLSPEGVPQLAGVISQGDSEGISIYIPISAFRLALNQSVR